MPSRPGPVDPERPLLTAAMIVRDEAAHLDDCLASLRSIVDEIVVVDTGSTDATPTIAEAHGAVVLHHRWNDDFAAARNVSLEHATGRWVLYIDADERIIACDRALVEDLLTATDQTAFRVLLRPSLGSTPYREYRLWRNDPRIRFRGRIHERVVDAIHAVAEQDGAGIGLADLMIQHVGYEGDQAAKHRRNLPLLQRRLEEEPSNLFVRHHLARVLDGLGRHDEAEEVLARAVAVVVASAPIVDPCGVLVYTDLIARRRDRGEPIGDLLAEARATYPSNLVLLYLEGRVLLDEGDHAAALVCFDQLLAVDPTTLPPDSPAYEQRLFGDLSHEGRALALFRAGRFGEAADAYACAERLDPSNPALAVKRQLAEARAGRPAGPS